MTFTHVHHGGFFWAIDRVAREEAILRLAAEVDQPVVITASDDSARDLGHRLGLSGLPVLVGTGEIDDGDSREVADAFATDSVSTLVASDSFLHRHGPVRSPLTVQMRVAATARDYNRRLHESVSPVHLTFVVPEDERHASSLIAHVGDAQRPVHTGADAIETVLDLTDGTDAAMARTRRRFPLQR